MPVERLIDHPVAMNMPGAAFGALCRVCHHYWVTECRPLPESMSELQTIARALQAVWTRHGHVIMEVFRDCQPFMDSRMAASQASKRGMLVLGQRQALAFGERVRKRHAANRRAEQGLPAEPEPVVMIPPRTLPRASKPAKPAPAGPGGMRDKLPV